MPQSVMRLLAHLRDTRAGARPEALDQFQPTAYPRGTTPKELMPTREPTVRNCDALNPNGVKRSAGEPQCLFIRRLQCVTADGSLHQQPDCDAEDLHPNW